MLTKEYLVYMEIQDDKWYVKDFEKIQKGTSHNSLTRDYRQGMMTMKVNAMFFVNILSKKYKSNDFKYINKHILERREKIKEILL